MVSGPQRWGAGDSLSWNPAGYLSHASFRNIVEELSWLSVIARVALIDKAVRKCCRRGREGGRGAKGRLHFSSSALNDQLCKKKRPHGSSFCWQKTTTKATSTHRTATSRIHLLFKNPVFSQSDGPCCSTVDGSMRALSAFNGSVRHLQGKKSDLTV